MKIPSKLDLIVWGVIGLCLLGLLLVVKGWHDDSRALPKVRAQVKQLEHNYTDLEQRAAANAERTEKHGNDFDKAEEQLDAGKSDTPARDVRLCVNESLRAPGGAARGDATEPDHAAGGERLPQAPGRDLEVSRDIGPELYALADEADRCAIQRDALIRWIAENPLPRPATARRASTE